MAVTTHASTPASVTNTGRPATLATGSFSPPPNLFMLALIGVGWNNAAQVVVSVSDSGSNTWTNPVAATVGTGNGGYAGIWVCRLGTANPGSIAVTAAFSGWAATGGGVSLDLFVLNGAAISQAGAAIATKVATATTTDATVNIVTTQAGSRVYGVTDTSSSGPVWTAVTGTGQDRQFNDATDAATIADWVTTPFTGILVPASTNVGGNLATAATLNTAALEVLPAPVAQQLILPQAVNRSYFF